jgi:hypothetical protein
LPKSLEWRLLAVRHASPADARFWQEADWRLADRWLPKADMALIVRDRCNIIGNFVAE